MIAQSVAIAALLLTVSAAHATSQDANHAVLEATATSPGIQLGIDSGPVLVSTGGEFAQAASGQVLNPGDRVLVSEGGSATLTYGSGCSKPLGAPGVYTITADCGLVGTSRSGPGAGVIAGVVGGVAVIAAAASGGGSDRPTPPVSR